MIPIKRILHQLRAWLAGKIKICLRKKVFNSVSCEYNKQKKRNSLDFNFLFFSFACACYCNIFVHNLCMLLQYFIEDCFIYFINNYGARQRPILRNTLDPSVLSNSTFLSKQSSPGAPTVVKLVYHLTLAVVGLAVAQTVGQSPIK